MNKTSRLKVLANFAKMGLAEDKTLYKHLKHWLVYQSVLQGILVHRSLGRLTVGDAPQRDLDQQCRFFITAHYGLYPMVICYLAALYPDRPIVCLVGKQQSLDGLNELAENYDINLQFVEVGQSFIALRRCVRHVKQGSVFLSLIDVPLGVSDKTDQELPFFSGQLRVRGGLLKLAEKLGLEPRFVLAGWAREAVPMTSYDVTGIESIFEHFEQHVAQSPHLWDKVIDLHKFYRTDVQSDLYLPFRIKDDYFLMELISDQVMRISEPLYHQIRRLGRPDCSPDEHARERQRIHEQTHLTIRHTV